jgi:hypothetical protein
MARIAGCILALDGVLVTLDRSGCPPPLAHGADHTDRALHAHATERVLLANMTLRGVTVAPETSTMLEALASRLGLVLLSEQSRAVTHALLAATSWGNHLRAVLCADDVATRPAADGHRHSGDCRATPREPSCWRSKAPPTACAPLEAPGASLSPAVGRSKECRSSRNWVTLMTRALTHCFAPRATESCTPGDHDCSAASHPSAVRTSTQYR